MVPIKTPLPETVQKTAGEALQGTLVDLIDLSLIAKQVHWTIVGRNFRSIHLQLDGVVDTARQYTDIATERAAAIGVLPDGRVSALRERSRVSQPPGEGIQAEDAIRFFVDVFDQMVARMRERIDATQEDPVTQDLLIETTAALEKQHWMWQAENHSR